MFRKSSRCTNRLFVGVSGPCDLQHLAGGILGQGVEKAVDTDTMLPWLLGPQLVISSSLWALGGRVHLQSVPSLDYPLSFPQQTPCYYPHPSLLCHLYKLSHPGGRASLRLQPAPCGGHRGQRSRCLACGPSSQEPVEPGWAASSSGVWARVVGGLGLARPDSTELDLAYLL